MVPAAMNRQLISVIDNGRCFIGERSFSGADLAHPGDVHGMIKIHKLSTECPPSVTVIQGERAVCAVGRRIPKLRSALRKWPSLQHALCNRHGSFASREDHIKVRYRTIIT